MPVLDSNLLIRLDHDDPVAVATVDRLKGETLVVPFQAALEFACGTRDPEDAVRAVAAAFDLQRPEEPTLQEAARLIAQARSKGNRVASGDAWIAASAVLGSDYVVTANKRHFRTLGVTAWNYMREKNPPQDRSR